MKKRLITFLFTFISTFSMCQQFQSLDDADWELWNRDDHKMHMVLGQVTTWVPGLVITYLDKDNPNICRGLLYSVPVSLTLTIGKELIWDYALQRGNATYPDLVYGITGTISGVVFTYLLYKLERWDVNKHEKMKL